MTSARAIHALRRLRIFLRVSRRPARTTCSAVDDPKARASQAHPAFADISRIIVNSKRNAATDAAALIIPAVGNNKLRHETLQRFMLVNDSVTVAIEVPILLTETDIAALDTEYGVSSGVEMLHLFSLKGPRPRHPPSGSALWQLMIDPRHQRVRRRRQERIRSPYPRSGHPSSRAPYTCGRCQETQRADAHPPEPTSAQKQRAGHRS